MDRRSFLRGLPGLLATSAAAQQLQTSPPRVPRERLDCAEALMGIEFSEAEEDMALTGVNRNLESYETLRKLEIPQSTEPPLMFRAYLPGKKPSGNATPGRKLRATTPRVPSTLTPEQIAFLPVTALAALVESRRITSIELTKLYLDRLKKHGGRLNAVITLTEDLALAQAASADADIASGRYRGPLHGIPWGAKDLLATRGYKTTWGAEPFKEQVFDFDATVVERLRDAGAVLVAKLAMGAIAQGAGWFGGSTRNPWNTDRSSSGSSAGPGAATAAGLVGFSIGTETLGSIMSPSATNGVVGLRPTYGRVSRHGAMSLSWTLDKIGPMCRSVEDCALVLNAIYGSDGRDDSVVEAPFEWNPAATISGLRIGYLQGEFDGGSTAAGRGGRGNMQAQQQTADARRTLYADALDVFRTAGATLEPMSLPDFPVRALNFILSTEAAAQFDDLTLTKGIDTLTAQGPGDWPNTFRTSRFVPAVEYLRAQRARRLLMEKMDALMSKYDAFISPTNSASLAVSNLTGHPAIALKAGFVDNLPVAIMITGRLYDEATLCRVALAYEQSTKWHLMHPAL